MDAFYWRLVATGLSFALFGLGGLVAGAIVLPVQRLFPGSSEARRTRARRTVQLGMRAFVGVMRMLGVLTYDPQTPQLRSAVVYQDELVLVVPPNHPLAPESQVSIQQLGAESFVAHNVSSPYREKVIEAFKRHKTPLHMDIELPTLQAIKNFVAAGNGVAFLPEISVENELVRGELRRIPVKELRLHRKLRLVYRKAASISHAAKAFLKVAESIATERRGRYRFEREH